MGDDLSVNMSARRLAMHRRGHEIHNHDNGPSKGGMMTSSDRFILSAGAGCADISPEPGIQLAGDIGRYRPAEEIRERLYVKALLLEAGGQRCCLLVLDLLSATNPLAGELRRLVGAKLGIPPEQVILHVTQNHAAPSLGHLFLVDDAPTLMPDEYPWLKGGDERYDPFCIARCLTAVEEAAARLQPMQVTVGRGIDGRVASNRRFVMRDGTVKTHPGLCDPNILYCEGPMDPEVGVMMLAGQDGRPVASLLHHTCHPIFGYPHRYVIGDWPGAWAEMMNARHGGVALVVNGCCGNISPTDHLDPDYYRQIDGKHRVVAEKLMETTETALGRLEHITPAPLCWKRAVLRLPMRALDTEVVDDARRYLDAYPEPKFLDADRTAVDWDWVYAVGRLDLYARQQRNPFFDYEIEVLRLGEAALVALMGEPFVEAQLRIKLESPAPYTFVAHFCNGYAGYIPIEEAFRHGGYETRTGVGSKFQPDALGQITETALRLLREVFAE